MTDFKPINMDDEMFEYECIDRELGSNLWRLDSDDTAPELRKRLETHVSFCADCRIRRRINAEMSTGLNKGHLQLPPKAGLNLFSRSVTATGFLALAASVLFMFMLPPVPAHQKMVVRGDDNIKTIISPIPDEVLLNHNPTISWQFLPEATSYQVRVEGVGNAYKWQQKTSDSQIQIPAGKNLPNSERFRVFVEPVPGYLAPAGGWRSSFSTASILPFLKYRIGAAPLMVQVMSLFSLGLLALGAITPLVRKRRLY